MKMEILVIFFIVMLFSTETLKEYKKQYKKQEYVWNNSCKFLLSRPTAENAKGCTISLPSASYQQDNEKDLKISSVSFY